MAYPNKTTLAAAQWPLLSPGLVRISTPGGVCSCGVFETFKIQISEPWIGEWKILDPFFSHVFRHIHIYTYIYIYIYIYIYVYICNIQIFPGNRKLPQKSPELQSHHPSWTTGPMHFFQQSSLQLDWEKCSVEGNVSTEKWWLWSIKLVKSTIHPSIHPSIPSHPIPSHPIPSHPFIYLSILSFVVISCQF